MWSASHYLEGDDILQGIDTSPGGGRFYRLIRPDGHLGAPWVKQQMRTGETVTMQKRVQFYFMSDCKPSADSSGNVMDTIRLVAPHLFDDVAQEMYTIC